MQQRAMDRPIRVAVIGCGWAGRRHAQALAHAGADVRWTVDRDGRRAQSVSGILQNARAATDYHQALDDRDVDAISICLPHDLHAPVALEAARAGKHILCEKPLAASLDDADRMI